jgi:hypothetical protein
MATYTYKPGLGQSAAYQVSGKPFVSGTIDAKTCEPRGTGTGDAGPGEKGINFPSVTSWITVINHAALPCRVGFSQNGVVGKGVSGGGSTNNYIVLGAAAANVPEMIGPLDLKVTQIWLSGSTDVDVIAGLTYIDSTDINNPSVSPDGVNWSGSLGAQVG